MKDFCSRVVKITSIAAVGSNPVGMSSEEAIPLACVRLVVMLGSMYEKLMRRGTGSLPLSMRAGVAMSPYMLVRLPPKQRNTHLL